MVKIKMMIMIFVCTVIAKLLYLFSMASTFNP